MEIIITGGAGFIGSELAKRLQENHSVKVVDNLSSGTKKNIPEKVSFTQLDIKDRESVLESFEGADVVFHFAANPVVSVFPGDREKDFEENLKGTKNVLDACIEKNVNELVFASSSVVYGEDAEIPTPETADFDPISMYGATKSGAEHICQVYAQSFDLDLTIVRYANIVSGKNPKGVTYDFVNKLEENPEKLTILGNGKQKKSYLYIDDTVEATLKAWKSDKEIFNIGSEDSIDVDGIAEIVAEEMDLNPEFEYTGGQKGWKGDVPEMRLDISKLKNEGWKPENSSEESIRKTVRELIEKKEN